MFLTALVASLACSRPPNVAPAIDEQQEQTRDPAVSPARSTGAGRLTVQERPLDAGLRLVYLDPRGDPTAVEVLSRRVSLLPGVGVAAVYSTAKGELVVEFPSGVDATGIGVELGRQGTLTLCPDGPAQDGDRVEPCPPVLGVRLLELRPAANGEPALWLELDDAAREHLKAMSSASVGRRLLIVLDGIVAIAPQIREPLTSGKALIEAGPWAGNLHVFVATMTGGPLQAPLELQRVELIR